MYFLQFKAPDDDSQGIDKIYYKIEKKVLYVKNLYLSGAEDPWNKSAYNINERSELIKDHSKANYKLIVDYNSALDIINKAIKCAKELK